jgi:hypothetical protein
MFFGKLSPAKFRDEFVSRLKQTTPDAKVRNLSDNEIEISSVGAQIKSLKVFLGAAYRDYRANPADKADIHRRFIQTVLAAGAPAMAPEARAATLVSIVRNRAWLVEMSKQASDLPANRVIAGDLIEVAAEARGAGFAYAGRSDVLALAEDEPSLWAQCRDNIMDRVGDAELRAFGSIYLVTAPSGIASSLLLADGFWARMPVPDPVVGLLCKDHFLFASASDPEALAQLQAQAEREASNPQMLSIRPIARRDGAWIVHRG